jgi:hypothetical protein
MYILVLGYLVYINMYAVCQEGYYYIVNIGLYVVCYMKI